MHTHTGPCCPDTAQDLPQCASSPWQMDGHLCRPLFLPWLGTCLGSANRQAWTGEVETTGKWRPLMKTVPRSSLSLMSCSCSPHLKPLHQSLHRGETLTSGKRPALLWHIPVQTPPSAPMSVISWALPNPGSHQSWVRTGKGNKQSGDLPSLRCPGSSCAGAGSGTQSSRQRCCPRGGTSPG